MSSLEIFLEYIEYKAFCGRAGVNVIANFATFRQIVISKFGAN